MISCETLCHDPHTLDGAFHKWKGRMLRATWNERPVHADVQARINAKTPSHEIMADHHALHKRKHELHRPNPSFKDDLAPLPDLKRKKRPRTAAVVGPRVATLRLRGVFLIAERSLPPDAARAGA